MMTYTLSELYWYMNDYSNFYPEVYFRCKRTDKFIFIEFNPSN